MIMKKENVERYISKLGLSKIKGEKIIIMKRTQQTKELKVI